MAAACVDCCLTLSCSSCKIRGTALIVGRLCCLQSSPADGEAGIAGVSAGALCLDWSQQSRQEKGKERLPAAPSLSGKGQELQLLAPAGGFEWEICTQVVIFNNWSRFDYLHRHIRHPWQEGGWIGRTAAGENSGLRKGSLEHIQGAG